MALALGLGFGIWIATLPQVRSLIDAHIEVQMTEDSNIAPATD